MAKLIMENTESLSGNLSNHMSNAADLNNAADLSNAATDDYMLRCVAASDEIRAFAVSSRGLVETARQAHNTSPIATAALGRTMSGALMMADMLKGEQDLLTIKIDSDGPLQGLLVTADNHGNVKGYVKNPNVILPAKADGHLNVGGAVGKGVLTVTRNIDGTHDYAGQVELYSGEIAEDLTHYFAESEQVPSAVGLGVLMNRNNTVREAGGFIIQLMPFASDATIDRLEQNLKNIPYVTDMMREGAAPEDLLRRALDGFDLHILEKKPVRFFCNCTRERTEAALLLLGEDELREIGKQTEGTDLTCQFCGKSYHFSPEQIQKLIAELKAGK